MIKEAIVKIVDKQDLTYQEAYQVMNEIMNGETTPTQNAAFLAALSTKSTKAETIDEITGCAAAMREHALRVDAGDMELMEIVGTGGDGAHSFNISTTSAFVACAGGLKIAKHGNRAASSQCGTADCLETLGVNIDLAPERCVEMLREVGMCFFFAQKYHTSMKYVGGIRKELGIRTVFNILGPLTNPARPRRILLGVYDPSLAEPLAQVLMKLGVERGMVVYGQDRLVRLHRQLPQESPEPHTGPGPGPAPGAGQRRHACRGLCGPAGGGGCGAVERRHPFRGPAPRPRGRGLYPRPPRRRPGTSGVEGLQGSGAGGPGCRQRLPGGSGHSG